MKLYLMRHGKAGTATSDRLRPLVDEGVDRVRLAGATLKMMGVVPGVILHSPAVRAEQTARIVAGELGVTDRLECVERLYDDDEYRPIVLDAVSRGPVLVVAHQPALEELAGVLAGGDCALKTGEVVCLRKVDAGLTMGRLAWRLHGNHLTRVDDDE